MSKLITSVEQFSASRLEAGDVKLVRVGPKWTLEASKQEANLDQVQKLLNALSGEKIRGFVSLNKAPPGEDKGLHVWFGTDADRQKHHWVFWKAKDQVFGRDLGSKRQEVFQFAGTLAQSLPWTPGFWTEKPGPAPHPSDTKGSPASKR